MAQRQYFSVVILLVSFKIMQTECSPPDHDFEILASDEVVGHRVGNEKVAGAYYAYSPLHLQRDLPTNVRSLTFASEYKTLVKQRVVSDSLESYVAKGDVLSVNLIAPNVKSFSILDTEIPNWSEDPWYFPNLRSLNYINDVVDSLRITTYGSDSLEILRIRQVSGSIIQFGYAPKLSKLRRFEISTDGKTTVTGLCEFISHLTMLEYILVVNVNNACLLNSIRNLKPYRKLKFVEIWMENEDIYQTMQVNDSTICSLFPESIETLHLRIKGTTLKLTTLSCYWNLKSLEITTNTQSPKIFYSPAPSARFIGFQHEGTCENADFGGLINTKFLSMEKIFTHCNLVPPLPNTEFLQFTDNNFQFSDGIEAFPDLRNVQYLDLTGNPITFVPMNAFRNMPLLSALFLESTNLRQFDSAAFCHLSWPRILVLGDHPPEKMIIKAAPGATYPRLNSIGCLTSSEYSSNIQFNRLNCSCDQRSAHYLSPMERKRYLAMHTLGCANYQDAFDYYVTECPATDNVSGTHKPIYGNARICKKNTSEIFLIIYWTIYVLFSWIPPPMLYLLHRRQLMRSVTLEQIQDPPKELFVICPRHARKWCKGVVIPCLEADLFTNPSPRLQRAMLRPHNTRQATKQVNQHGHQSSDSFGHEKVHRIPNVDGMENSQRITSSRTTSSISSMRTIDMTRPKGPWTWQPRLKCHLPPPARHRLPELMRSSRVLIVFPSASLFTEPACRAQLRIAFHLCRLERIPPPTILVWPSNETECRLASDYSSVNQTRNISDHDKYYPVPMFNTVTNDPDDLCETAVIKAKVPTVAEATEIVMYFSTISCPCVKWYNWKTALENLKPLLWFFNKLSGIPPY